LLWCYLALNETSFSGDERQLDRVLTNPQLLDFFLYGWGSVDGNINAVEELPIWHYFATNLWEMVGKLARHLVGATGPTRMSQFPHLLYFYQFELTCPGWLRWTSTA
jgi:hypothetical protein